MLYSIPVNKLDKLEKIIRKYQRKGADITFTVGKDIVEDGMLYFNDPSTHTQGHTPIKVNCKEVFVDGQYKVEDWSFLGTIEFTENGNIIRLADSSFEGKVPAKYLHTPKVCEHCGKVRNRKDTYLIHNDVTDEYKQVGSSCLLDYTKGLDADACASMMSCLDKIIDLSSKDYDEASFFGNGYDSTGCGINAEDIKPYAIALVKKFGYHKMENGSGSATDLANFYFKENLFGEWDKMFGEIRLATEDEVKAIDEYAQQYIDADNMYMRNASLAWLRKSWEYRDFGLVCSFVNTYLKEMNKIASNKANGSTFVGNIGDRITIKVSKARVLYMRDNSYKSYYAPASYVWEIIGSDNNIYIWSAAVSDLYEGDVITATVKAHNEYKGSKQTIITRGKVTRA